MMRIKRKLVICADDYAQNEAISSGIIQAVVAQRLNAVSCLTTALDWPHAGVSLREFNHSTMIGLHFNLTQGQPLSAEWKKHHGSFFFPLSSIITASYLKRLKTSAIAAEFCAQLQAFQDVMGCAPDFIDGHQHIHQLPGIREQLLMLYQQKKLQAWIRSSVSSWQMFGLMRSRLIACLGGYTLRNLLFQEGIPMNTTFSGVYPFHQAER